MIERERSPEARPPVEATVDYQNAADPADGTVGQVRVLPRAAPEAQTATVIQALLRKRLRLAFLLSAVICGIGVLLYLVNIWLMHGPPPRVVWQSLTVTGVIAFFAFGFAVLLASKQPLSVRQLRAIELVLVALFVLIGVWRQSSYLESAGYFAHFRDDVRLSVLASYHSLFWFAGLATYGLFVPNTWRRCAVVLGVIALGPFAVLAVDMIQPEGRLEGRSLVLYVTVLGIWTAFGAGLALFGSYHFTVLQRQASAARLLGQYRLTQRLGTGGMGEVYLAEHLLLRRPCAIKLIRPERAGDLKNLLRFEREVQVTATLTHPNTVQVFDYGHAEDGTFYYVMEYLPGVNLEELVKQHGRLPPERAVHLLRQVCGALHEAHAVGLIHRDIKPSNIIACERGGQHDVAKLLDFGLVRWHGLGGDPDNLTQEGAVAGTPAYMSPEQAAGPEHLDCRSDIYSLGALGYFLLTGQPPFAGRSSVQMLAAHLYESPLPLTNDRPDVPVELQAIVLRCLAKDPAERFPNAQSLEKALAGCPTVGQWTEEEASYWWRSQSGPNESVGSERVNEGAGLTRRCN
jgi:hypothetical protein